MDVLAPPGRRENGVRSEHSGKALLQGGIDEAACRTNGLVDDGPFGLEPFSRFTGHRYPKNAFFPLNGTKVNLSAAEKIIDPFLQPA